MKTKTLSLALIALVSLSPLAQAREFHGGFGGERAFRGGHFAAPARQPARISPTARVAARNWDRRREYFWHGHRYCFISGDWFIVDFWPYPFDGGYVYDYDVGSVYAAPVVTDTPIVAQVQRKLDQQGYNAGPANGQFGQQTSAAIARYQRDHRLPVTGTIGRPLLRSLQMA